MKTCPQCGRVETDETLRFCRLDGAVLNETTTDEFSDTRILTTPQTGEQRILTDTTQPASTTDVDGHATRLIDSETAETQHTSSAIREPRAAIIRAKAAGRRSAIAIFAVIAIAVLILGIGGLVAYRRARNTTDAINSIAVLPFENQNHDPDSEYLSDGLTESIIYRLSQLPNLKVSPRSSVFHYKGNQSDPIKVGNELHVNAVLSGRIIQRGDQITISTELTDVRYSKLIWGEQYDRKM